MTIFPREKSRMFFMECKNWNIDCQEKYQYKKSKDKWEMGDDWKGGIVTHSLTKANSLIYKSLLRYWDKTG